MTALVQEVDRQAVDLGTVVMERVHGPLAGAPVVAVTPVVDELAQVPTIGPVRPVVVGEVVGQPGTFEAPPEVVERRVGQRDLERMSGQGVASSARSGAQQITIPPLGEIH